MLRLRDPQLKLWDTMIAQPELFRLPARLLDVDRMLDDDRVFAPMTKRLQQRIGRPTIPMDCYLRMMYLKHERGLGYETLVQEVADSLTLRRFCRLDISDPVPHSTTLIRMTRRLGSEFVAELHGVVVNQLREQKLVKGQRLRTDTTVMEADVEYPTDAGLLTDGVRVINRVVDKLKQAGAKLGGLGDKLAEGFRDSTQTMRRVMFDIHRFLKKRVTAAGQPLEEQTQTGAASEKPADAKAQLRKQVDGLTAEAARVAARTIDRAREVARRAGRRVARASKDAKASVKRICLELVAWADLTQRALDQTRLRLAGQTSIPNRMVSLFDPEARPIRKGKLSQPVQFGSLVEVTQAENTVITDYQVHIGNPGDQTHGGAPQGAVWQAPRVGRGRPRLLQRREREEAH